MLHQFTHLLPPEKAHALAIGALKRRLLLPSRRRAYPTLITQLAGLSFANPVGLAAGFDKNAEAIDGLIDQGFGFVEAGTVTPRPQPGNPRPRLFRLSEDRAIINRLGFNGKGRAVFIDNMKRAKRGSAVIGANIGRNADSDDPIEDYVLLFEAVGLHADYVTVNVSSPNTQGLRALQQRTALDALLEALMEKRNTLTPGWGRRVPIFLKIAPDLDEAEKEAIADVSIARGVDALIVSNTTIARPITLKSLYRNQQGGLSGPPVFAKSTEALRDMYRLTHGRLPLVGVGGISNAADAYAKIKAGASLVQVYTALIYQGFGVVRQINKGLLNFLKRDGFSHISEAVGIEA